MSEPRGFVTPAVEAPKVSENERLLAKVLDIRKVEGKYGDQLQFELELENGYTTKAWMPFYEHPSTKTDLGKLGLAIMRQVNRDIYSIEEAIDWLTHYGIVYVECTGVKKYENDTIPKFKIVPGILPTPEPRSTKLDDDY